MHGKMLNIPAASKLSQLSYIPRIIGFILMGLILLSNFHSSLSTGLFTAIIVQCLVWPHLAHLYARLTPFKKSAEAVNGYIDAFLYGIWTAATGYQVWIILALFLVNSINSLIVGGFKGVSVSILLMALGSVSGGLWLGFDFTKESSLETTVTSALGIYLYCMNVGYFSRKNTNRINKARKLIAEAKTEAEEATRAKSDFLANMSHEIRTPMNAILGTLQLLESANLDKKSKELIIKASFSAKTLLTIINDILDYSKIEANQIVFEEQPFSILDVMDSIKSDLAAQARSKRIYLKIRATPEFSDGWLGDLVRVRQVILNLVSNAVKFTQQGGVSIQLSVEPYQNGEALCISVADTGIGMDEEQRLRIFERFAQADCSTTRQFGGTGLGLAISLNLVELMSGDLRVQSTSGEGTQVQVLLPLKRSELKKETITTKPQTVPDLSGKVILIAEDNDINQVIIGTMLEPTSARIIFAENGKVAIESYQQHRPDVVLMDIQMPEMDGIHAFKVIHDLNPELPVVALTANILTEDVQKYQHLGFVAHVGKPIEMPKLYEVLGCLF